MNHDALGNYSHKEVANLKQEINFLRTELAAHKAQQEHVCGLQGFGALDDVCPACSSRTNTEAQRAGTVAVENGMLRLSAGILEDGYYDIVKIERPIYSANIISTTSPNTEALRKDAERLNWLESNPRHAQILVEGKLTDCVFYGISCAQLVKLRDAIDAAMKGE